jgi:hypothetical protein
MHIVQETRKLTNLFEDITVERDRRPDVYTNSAMLHFIC